MTDLSSLIRVSRGVRVERLLVCPVCSGPCELRDYRMVCGSCGGSFAKLAELAAVPEARAR